jgi:hypothetical protein
VERGSERATQPLGSLNQRLRIRADSEARTTITVCGGSAPIFRARPAGCQAPVKPAEFSYENRGSA